MGTNRRFRFTKDDLTAIPPPPSGRRAYVYDTFPRAKGLGLAVTPAGTKTFFLHRRVDGRPERIRIGSFPTLTVEQARKAAITLNAEIDQGGNPQDDRRQKRAEITFGELFAEYLEKHAKPHKKTWRQDEQLFDGKLRGPWGARKVSSISRRDVQSLHVAVGRESGNYRANRLLALISSVFNKGASWGLAKGENPAAGVPRFRERSRERFLQADELPRFFKALGEEPNQAIQDAVLLMLLTGARRNNVLSMRWEDLDLRAGLWHIPDTKSGESHTVPLVPQAVAILEARQPDGSPWVLPTQGRGRTSASGHLAEIKTAWENIRVRAGLPGLRLHDLRRTLGSWQAAQGASLAVIGRSLAHKNVSTTLIYSRLTVDPVRESMERATAAIFAGREADSDSARETENGD
ncbi:MAG: site-specific integrase [Krumholzibacteria bacterium]|nr:site-specific integrase [Candidatus Krumholzibacteria bacterium]